ncbi:GntR family transcriptional regulator [Xylanimonas allomyrinae]|uniref:GntR family transcriptional regulator n=1 Tax=Xylanimonas allomyrinae TaxID=2509459 RepID=UPI00268B3BDF
MATRPTSSGAEAGAAVTLAYTALRMPIVDGRIAPGTRINIDALARDLGVSQTPVRESLQRLEADGLLVYTPGRGYRTTPTIDLAELRAIFEFRLLVEPWAARAVAGDRLVNPASPLETEISAFVSAIEAGGSERQEMLTHDTRFHDLILAATGNEVVRHAYAQTHCHLHVFRLAPADADGRSPSRSTVPSARPSGRATPTAPRTRWPSTSAARSAGPPRRSTAGRRSRRCRTTERIRRSTRPSPWTRRPVRPCCRSCWSGSGSSWTRSGPRGGPGHYAGWLGNSAGFRVEVVADA